MTEAGAMIFGTYSLAVVILLAAVDFAKMAKGKSNGLKFVLLLFVAIYLINVIGKKV